MYVCFPHSFRIEVTQNLPPAILVSKNKNLEIVPKLDVFFSEKMTSARWPAFFSASKNQQLWKPSPSGPGGVRPIDGQHCSSDPYSVDAERKRLEEVEGGRKTTKKPVKNDVPTALVSPSKWV